MMTLLKKYYLLNMSIDLSKIMDLGMRKISMKT